MRGTKQRWPLFGGVCRTTTLIILHETDILGGTKLYTYYYFSYICVSSCLCTHTHTHTHTSQHRKRKIHVSRETHVAEGACNHVHISLTICVYECLSVGTVNTLHRSYSMLLQCSNYTPKLSTNHCETDG